VNPTNLDTEKWGEKRSFPPRYSYKRDDPTNCRNKDPDKHAEFKPTLKLPRP
jgi:hypothetical protein